jgi:hypothetical protein
VAPPSIGDLNQGVGDEVGLGDALGIEVGVGVGTGVGFGVGVGVGVCVGVGVGIGIGIGVCVGGDVGNGVGAGVGVGGGAEKVKSLDGQIVPAPTAVFSPAAAAMSCSTVGLVISTAIDRLESPASAMPTTRP